MRSPQARLNGYLMDAIDVREVREVMRGIQDLEPTESTSRKYRITLSPQNCGHDFSLPNVVGAKV